MRPFKPAPKNASANRIRERYLHQLGLQRGVGAAPLAAPNPSSNNHVVVISGLPSLPEDRATTEHVMESHDFSIAGHSQHTGGDTAGGGSVGSTGENNDSESDSGSNHGAANPNAPLQLPSYPQDVVHSQSSKGTLSQSPTCAAGEHLTSMALAYPTALRKASRPVEAMPPPPAHSNTVPFSLWRPGGMASLSKPASVMLDSAGEYRHFNDGDSVSSAGTSTTAESSLTATAAMVSRDWGAMPPPSAAHTSPGLGESPASAPGVYFQCGHPRLIPGQPHCASSSLANALNRFNIDSDCEASSVASGSIVEDHCQMMDEDDAVSLGDASHASYASHTSVGSASKNLSSSVGSSHSHLSQARAARAKKKIGKTQRLMDRAAAHERILQIRSDRSRCMRASVVHSQRMGNPNNASGLSSAMMGQGEEGAPQLSESPCSASSGSAASLPLVHVQHGKQGNNTGLNLPDLKCNAPHNSIGGLGRTPTSSNCNSDLRRLKAMEGGASYQFLPPGIHLSALQGPTRMAPLMCHPRFATRIPTPPPMPAAGMLPSVLGGSSVSVSTKQQEESDTEECREPEGSTASELQHANHQATIDDVMEVAMTLSRLGEHAGDGSGGHPVPRIR
eukprot:CAMPEP_0172577426 /NCGR_PEP_ID=MMETSP1067-20121228/138225_1 /TAXON_ID=265564 ORGANISM="Thalassiosira punctigera, Strain Tpunct2005C2" /NCGR_SAMPLE_ID=MMETSP1067 /ASSEMBLY_ACC=CAM_ASM_000444 /LENGTH=618 /DNA_ID=CAMNT_0013370113 /DNA_START=1509 /DNA_END=3365 /DNA_ORIENTATION=+